MAERGVNEEEDEKRRLVFVDEIKIYEIKRYFKQIPKTQN